MYNPPITKKIYSSSMVLLSSSASNHNEINLSSNNRETLEICINENSIEKPGTYRFFSCPGPDLSNDDRIGGTEYTDEKGIRYVHYMKSNHDKTQFLFIVFNIVNSKRESFTYKAKRWYNNNEQYFAETAPKFAEAFKNGKDSNFQEYSIVSFDYPNYSCDCLGISFPNYDIADEEFEDYQVKKLYDLLGDILSELNGLSLLNELNLEMTWWMRPLI
ncbi:MAG: hypothetical protein MJ221_04985, partial [Bacilli bacterium]|nr:hypothetical protein [Bacilli bacterium]